MSIESLPGDVPPPPGLEDRTAARLRSEGWLSGSSRHRWRWLNVAAGLVLFVAGAASGAMFASEPEIAPGQARYLLMLHGAPTASADDEQRAVAAYRAWAMRLRDEGRFVNGARLGTNGVVLPYGQEDDPVQGYFVVSAASFEEAVAIARTAPHLARGGRVVVRMID
jgi:hypothetical protein